MTLTTVKKLLNKQKEVFIRLKYHSSNFFNFSFSFLIMTFKFLLNMLNFSNFFIDLLIPKIYILSN